MPIAWLLLVSTLLAAEDPGVVIESSPRLWSQFIGTDCYSPTATEKSFSSRITEQTIDFDPGWIPPRTPEGEECASHVGERRDLEPEHAQYETMIPVTDYILTRQSGCYVGWCGILRAKRFDAASASTICTIQHTYFDHLCESRTQVTDPFGAEIIIVAPWT